MVEAGVLVADKEEGLGRTGLTIVGGSVGFGFSTVGGEAAGRAVAEDEKTDAKGAGAKLLGMVRGGQ